MKELIKTNSFSKNLSTVVLFIVDTHAEEEEETSMLFFTEELFLTMSLYRTARVGRDEQSIAARHCVS